MKVLFCLLSGLRKISFMELNPEYSGLNTMSAWWSSTGNGEFDYSRLVWNDNAYMINIQRLFS